MGARWVRAVGLVVLSVLGLSSGLQPVLASVQRALVAERGQSKDGTEETAARLPAEPESSGEPDEQPAETDDEQGAAMGGGLCDWLDRGARSAKAAHIGAAVAGLPLHRPASKPDHPGEAGNQRRQHVDANDWGQEAHWPCGPPVR